jgi:uncharacterized protein YbbC (DUF1343 family)
MSPARGMLRPGISWLLTRRREWLSGRRLGLLTHTAAVNNAGVSSLTLLAEGGDWTLRAILAPEHGLFGAAGAGEAVRDRLHPVYRIPVLSLYGPRRRPPPDLLRDLDVVVCDLQDLGVRCYTYGSTLLHMLEAVRDAGKTLIVADRPVPLPTAVDGPLLDPAFTSFVGTLPTPLVYGMTPGETALWLRRQCAPGADVRVAPLEGYHRQPWREPRWPPWIPPSPGIRSWETGHAYAATVFGEALPALDVGRGTALVFQVIGAPWLDARRLRQHLEDAGLPGVTFHLHPYLAGAGCYEGRLLLGVRLTVTEPHRFRPATTAVHILTAIHRLHGPSRLWKHADTRPDFFDRLWGTSSVREALARGAGPNDITASWNEDLRRFRRLRAESLLYPLPSRSGRRRQSG